MTPDQDLSARLLPCPFCGAELIVGKHRIASCKTEGCAVQHRGVDLDYPKHIAAWNTRASGQLITLADHLMAVRQAIADHENRCDSKT